MTVRTSRPRTPPPSAPSLRCILAWQQQRWALLSGSVSGLMLPPCGAFSVCSGGSMANADSLHARARFFRPLRAVPRPGRTSTSRDALVRRRAELPTCFTSAYSLLVKYDRFSVNTESLTVNTNIIRPVCDKYDPKVSPRRVGSDADRFERLYSRSHEAVCATRPPPVRVHA